VTRTGYYPSPVFGAFGARSLESLVEGHNWFLNQFVEIPRRSVIVFFFALSAKAGLNLSPFEISCAGIFK
jgi:hypothetical protein